MSMRVPALLPGDDAASLKALIVHERATRGGTLSAHDTEIEWLRGQARLALALPFGAKSEPVTQ